MPVTISCNIPAIKGKLDSNWKQHLPLLCEQVLTDCNYFVRVDTGTMRSSSLTASDMKSGELIWDTPYASKVYYTGTPSHDVNPNASLQWCEKAKGQFGGQWQALAQRLFEDKG